MLNKINYIKFVCKQLFLASEFVAYNWYTQTGNFWTRQRQVIIDIKHFWCLLQGNTRQWSCKKQKFAENSEKVRVRK